MESHRQKDTGWVVHLDKEVRRDGKITGVFTGRTDMFALK